MSEPPSVSTCHIQNNFGRIYNAKMLFWTFPPITDNPIPKSAGLRQCSEVKYLAKSEVSTTTAQSSAKGSIKGRAKGKTKG